MVARLVKTEKDYQIVKMVLQDHKLPSTDIDQDTIEAYSFFEDEIMLGTGAIEILEDSCLLRSLSIHKDFRNRGYGLEVIKYLERLAKSKGFEMVYILTEIPEYFSNKDYHSILRADAPNSIKSTSEFTTFCPSSAKLMTKEL